MLNIILPAIKALLQPHLSLSAGQQLLLQLQAAALGLQLRQLRLQPLHLALAGGQAAGALLSRPCGLAEAALLVLESIARLSQRFLQQPGRGAVTLILAVAASKLCSLSTNHRQHLPVKFDRQPTCAD